VLKFSHFRYHGNRGWSETNSTCTVKFANPENPVWCKNQEHISHRSPVITNFVLKFSNFRCHGNKGRPGVSVNDTSRFAAIENPLLGARISNTSTVEAELQQIFCQNFQIFITIAMGWSETNFTYTVKFAIPDWPQYLHVGWSPRRNQLCQIFWKSTQVFQCWQTPKYGISHWLCWSLQHSHTTMYGVMTYLKCFR